jgi:heptosyltransferase II
MERILLIGPYGVGNLILVLPAIAALRKTERFRIEVACLVPSIEDMCRNVPEISRLFDNVHALHTGHGWTRLARTAWHLRRERFDRSVLMFPSGQAQYNLANLAVGARMRIGSRYPEQPWRHLSHLNTRRVPVQPGLHDSLQNVKLLAEGLDIALPVPTSYVFRRLRQDPLLVGVHPGCKYADRHKRWGIARFLDALRLLHDTQPRLRFRVFFGPDEQDDRKEFLSLLETPSYPPIAERMELPDRLTILALMDAIGGCGTMIASDSGLMHLAAAQGVRTLGIFGPSDEVRTAPLAPGCSALYTDITCRPCYRTSRSVARPFHCVHEQQYCLTDLKPERVLSWFQGAESELKSTVALPG